MNSDPKGRVFFQFILSCGRVLLLGISHQVAFCNYCLGERGILYCWSSLSHYAYIFACTSEGICNFMTKVTFTFWLEMLNLLVFSVGSCGSAALDHRM